MAVLSLVAFVVGICLIMLATFHLLTFSRVPYKRLPPGPRPWPLVGNLFQLREGQRSMVRLSEKYGPACTVWVGSVPIIIISGPDSMHECLVRHADAFSARFDRYSTKCLTAGYNIISLSSGSYWKVSRRNFKELLNPRSQGSHECDRASEFQEFVDRVRNEAKNDPNGEVSVLRQIRATLLNIFSILCFGERIADESTWAKVDRIFEKQVTLFLGGLSDYFLLFRPFEWVNREVRAQIKRVNNLLMPHISKYRNAFKKEADSGKYVDVLLKTQAQHAEIGLEHPLTDEMVVALCAELLTAGMETTATALEWALGLILCHPNTQRKLVHEMEEVLGDKKLDEADIDRLPYLQAVVRESLRLRSPGDFTLPYRVTRAGLKIGEFDIPMDASILFRLTSVHSDPNIWSEPDLFKPERFIEVKSGSKISGSKMSLASFSLGKRICPGMNIALKIMPMLLGSLVQAFELSTPGPEYALPDMTRTTGSVSKMQSRLRVCLRERKPPTDLPSKPIY